MGLNRLDKVILVLPVLGVFDVLSTLYAGYLGYSLERHEAGFLAGFFARHGLLYLYIPVYLGILVSMAWALLRIKRRLNSSAVVDRVVFLLLVGVVCFIYARLFGTILMNVLLFSDRKTSSGLVEGVVYLFIIGYVVILLWRDVVQWMRGE
ncbi:MAG: hypothetical protein ACE5IF_01265 [Candidatus Bathyarchaeia archaeon]